MLALTTNEVSLDFDDKENPFKFNDGIISIVNLEMAVFDPFNANPNTKTFLIANEVNLMNNIWATPFDGEKN
jgi:hypothetical protein